MRRHAVSLPSSNFRGSATTWLAFPEQAPNCFGEPVRETLPNTELEPSVVGQIRFWQPETDGDVLVPVCELTTERFERYDRASYDCASYDRAGDASLRFALNYARGENAGDYT